MIQDPFFWGLLVAGPVIFWVLPNKLRIFFLAAASFGLVLYLDAFSACLLLALAILLYALLPTIAGGRRYASLSLCLILTVLIGTIVYNKYLPLIFANLTEESVTAAAAIVPLGMSFYIFKMIHVAVDAFRRRSFSVPIAQFFCYLFLFTTFSAGPIQRLDLFLEGQEGNFRWEFVVEGLTRLAYGFVKQFFLVAFILPELGAALLPHARAVDNAAHFESLDTGALWLTVIFTYLVGYLNFGAYTDIAIGFSRLFGFHISENFNFPIVACSIREFWQRWHMTLAAWAQAYIYSPLLGLTRNPYIALFASMLVIGIWHAGTLNRVAWGLFHATGILIATIWARYSQRRKFRFRESFAWTVVGWTLTQGYVAASMIFVLGELNNDVRTSGRLLLKLFGISL